MPTTTVTADELKQHVNRLQSIGTQMESAGDPRWLPIAQSAAILEGLRLGLTTIKASDQAIDWTGINQAQPRFIGIDMAKPGKDTTATYRGDCHA